VDGAKVDYKAKYAASQQAIKDNYANFEVPYYGKDNDDYVNGQGFCCDDTKSLKSFQTGTNDNPELFQYYYHSDHLGSSSLITNLDGEIVQHIEYVPFGEVFIEERNNTWNTPYLFNAKELDEETGLYYYGARYYDPRISIWLSTDPLQEKYPNVSTYAYCILNPVKLIEPNGMDPIFINMADKASYGVVIILPSDYNKDSANGRDYSAGKSEKLPMIIVNDIADFKEAMKQMQEKGITTTTYSLVSHGAPGLAYIGKEEINAETDFSSLKEGLQDKFVFLFSCEVTKGQSEAGKNLISKFATEASATVVSSDHLLQAGYKYDGGDLNEEGTIGIFRSSFEASNSNSNDFHAAFHEGTIMRIYDVKIERDGNIYFKEKDRKP
jgi:RHS repeat-associated protein